MNVVLLDRDGTIIVGAKDLRVDSEEKVELFDDSVAALQYLADNDFAVIIVTNQAGIEEGRIDEEDFWRIHNEVLRRLEPSGANILKTYMNGEAPSPNASQWRKPGPNMILQAAKDFDLSPKDIYMIGDRQTDIQAATNAGCKGGILVQTANESVTAPDAVFTAPHLMDAVKYVVENS